MARCEAELGTRGQRFLKSMLLLSFVILIPYRPFQDSDYFHFKSEQEALYLHLASAVSFAKKGPQAKMMWCVILYIYIYIFVYTYTCRFLVKKGLQKAKHDDMVLLCG